jgi:RIO-like serine/threonine protein kinase
MVLKLRKKSAELINSMMKQYEALKQLNAPVIQILNNPREDKFFIMEKVSMFSITWNETQKPSEVAFEQLAEIRKMIAIAKEHKIDLDLKPSNVGIDANGRVVLFDFREEISEDEDEYLVSLNSAVVSFSNGNKIVENYLSTVI